MFQKIKAGVAELVDALDLGSSILTDVGVRVPPLVHFVLIKSIKTIIYKIDFLKVSQKFPNIPF